MVPGEETSEEAQGGLDGRISFKRLRIAFWLIGIALIVKYPVLWLHSYSRFVTRDFSPLAFRSHVCVGTGISLVGWALLTAGIVLMRKASRHFRFALALAVVSPVFRIVYGFLLNRAAAEFLGPSATWSTYAALFWLPARAVSLAMLVLVFLGIRDVFLLAGKGEYAASAVRRGIAFVVAAFACYAPDEITLWDRVSHWLTSPRGTTEALLKAIPVYAAVVAVVALIMLLHLLYRATKELPRPEHDHRDPEIQ